MGTSAAWTPERRAKHAENIRRWKPWKKSTGPRTSEGKARSSRNADKGVSAMRSRIADARRQVRMDLALQSDEGLISLRLDGMID